MGYDKPDLGFCIHVGSPDSPVAYYQQVGRAGRALDDAVGVLLPAPESDERIWDYFATATIPDPQAADRLLRTLDAAGRALTVPALESETGLRRGRLEALLKTLRVDGAVDRVAEGWMSTGAGWQYDADKYERVVAARRAEAALMRTYAAGERCLMEVLTEALDDPAAGRCGRCSVCTGELPPPGPAPDEERVRAARRFLRQRDVVVEPRRQWPNGLTRPDPLRGRLLAGVARPGDRLRRRSRLAVRDRRARRCGRRAQRRGEGGAGGRARPLAPGLGRPPRRRGRPAEPEQTPPGPGHGGASGRGRPAPAAGAARRAPVPPPEDDVASSVRVGQLIERLTPRPVGTRSPTARCCWSTTSSRTRWTLTVASALLRSAGVPAVLPVVGHQRP